MQILLRVALILGFLGTIFTAIACAVDDWQTGNGGFKIGLWRSCTAETGCTLRKWALAAGGMGLVCVCVCAPRW